MPLACDCFPGCWADHSAGWPLVRVPGDYVTKVVVPLERHSHANACQVLARASAIGRGSYVVVEDGLRCETLEFAARAEHEIDRALGRSAARPRSAAQDWLATITVMKQSVLFAAIRGPDGVRKDHISKCMLRWFRRCVLISAFDGRTIDDPFETGGGSFTGPSCLPPNHEDVLRAYGDPTPWPVQMSDLLGDYMRTLDEVPHHFQLHFLHAAEILGWHHPSDPIRAWWRKTYVRLCNDMHLPPEEKEAFDRRLGDREDDWRAAEEVTAERPYGREERR